MKNATLTIKHIACLLLLLVAIPSHAFKVKRSGAVDLLAEDKRYFYQHELSVYAVPCYSWLQYADLQGQSSYGKFNVGAGFDYRFFFHQNVGISLGLQYMPYTGQYQFDAFEQVSSGIDNSDPLYPNNPYTYIERYHVTEVANLHYLEVPIKFVFITPSWNKVQLRTAVGLNIGYNIATKQSLTGFYDAEMIYTDNHVTLDESESLYLGRYNDIEIHSPQTVLDAHFALLAEVGIGIKISERWQFNLDLYGSYSLNNAHATYNEFIAMNRGYQGIVTTQLVGNVHPISLGAKVSFSVYLGKPKAEILPPWKKRKLKGFNESLNGYTNQNFANETSQDTPAATVTPLTEPIQTEPNVTEPVIVDPTTVELAITEAIMEELTAVEPAVAEPVIEEPTVVAPVITDTTAVHTPVTNPIATEIVVAEPTIEEPKTVEPAVAEPVVAKAIITEPVVAEPVIAEPQQPKWYKPRALNAPILFHLNSMDLTDASYRIFKHMVASLQENTPKKIIVVGYTCSMGDEKDNLHLGKYRAEKVKYLLEQNGLQHVTIETETRGENNPHLPNTTEQNRKQNRCVDLIYIY